jgi:hypothetical protein
MNTNSSPKPHSHAAGSHHGLNRRDFVRLAASGTGLALTQVAVRGIGAPTTPNGPGAIRFALIGDFGETLADQTFPVDRVGALIRSWNPDFVVTSGDNNYVLGEASTIDVNVGKNFTGYIYPKSTTIPTQYPYPPGSPTYNRFIPCLGNHDYGDVADDALPSLDNVAKNAGYQQYLRNALRVGTALAPNTTITFADNAVGQTWSRSLISGEVEDFAPFQESENLRFYDVRLGTASGPSSVHLFILDSDSPTPYGRYSADRVIPNRDGSPSQFTEKATQAAWLKQRLAASTARWKIVILHHPPYNSAPGAENSQYTFARWPYQAWGASAVITGHVHNYERLQMPDPDENLNPKTGGPTIPYIVNGSGGFIPEQGFDPSFVVPGSLVRVAEYGAQLITADENSINFLYYDLDGVLRDVCTLYANDSQGAPQVEFAGNEFPVGSDSGTVSITVTRLGDASQPLTVNYATMDGTAVAGTNYVATSGALQFAANERTKTIPVTILPPPFFPPGTVPWESLIFTVGLSSPSEGALGFFNVSSVIIYNLTETPITNQVMFINQTYLDLFQRTPTATEFQAAQQAIGGLDLWIYRAQWIYNLLMASKATEPVFPVALSYAFLQLSDISWLASQAAPPSFPDLKDGLRLYRNADSPADGLITLSEAFNQNALEIVYYEFPSAETDNTFFVQNLYTLLITTFGSATQADLDYWLGQLSNASDAQRNLSRQLMLGRMATESFDPPPNPGMTPFDLTKSSNNGNKALMGILIAGLLRIQLTMDEFIGGYVLPARLGSAVIIDLIYNMLQSPQYAARFRVTSYDGYIDSAKGLETRIQRAPYADPDRDGLNNLEEYSFALPAGDASPGSHTDLEVVDESGQRFGIFSYRVAKYVRQVEFLVQISTNLKDWTVVSAPQPAGGEDLGAYLRRRVRIPIPSTTARQYFRVRVRERF